MKIDNNASAFLHIKKWMSQLGKKSWEKNKEKRIKLLRKNAQKAAQIRWSKK
jgi:hypothetical protein